MSETKKRILVVNEFSQFNTGFSTYMHYVLPRLYETGKYEIAELATYVKSNDPRLDMVPWKVYVNEPSDPSQQEAYAQSRENQFGKFSFEQVCLDFKPDIVCMPPESIIATEEGYKKISDVTITDKVLTHTGKYKPVLKTMRKEHRGTLYKIYAHGDNSPISLTAEHPVLVYRKRKQTNQKKSISKIYQGLQPEFVPAKDIRINDLVVFPKNTEERYSHVNTSDYLENFVTIDHKLHPGRISNTNGIHDKILLNENFGRLCGYIIGDGHVAKGGITIMFQGNEREFALDTQNLYKSIFGLESTIRKEKDKYAFTIICNSVLLSEFFGKFLGLRTETKFIPKEIRFGPEESKRGMVSGLVRADGCYKENTVSLCTINKNLAYEYRQICIDLDIPISINYNKNNHSFAIEGYGSSAEKLAGIVQKLDKNLGESSAGIGKGSRRTQIVNNHMIASIKRIRKEPYNGLVYNLEVAEDNSYVSNWCVHNCDIRDPWMCFTGDTSVLMSDGTFTKIQNLQSSNQVISNHDSINKTSGIRSREYAGTFIDFILSTYTFEHYTVTAEHPILACEKYHGRYVRDIDKYQFIQASELTNQHTVAIPINHNISHNKTQKYSNEFLFGLGFFVAEGCYLKHKGVKDGVQLTGHRSEKELIKNILETLKNTLDDRAVIHKDYPEGDNRYVGRIGSKIIANFMFDNFGEYASGKKIASWISRLPLSQLAYFVQGMIVGDGSDNAKTRRGRYYSINKELVRWLHYTLLRLGIKSTVNKGFTILNNKSYSRYILNISPQKDNYQLFHILYTNPEEFKPEKIDYIFCSIKDVRQYEDTKTVYNFEVENSHTYCVPFITHNCSWIEKSPYRKHFKWIEMPTVDGEPQKEEWLDTYMDCDLVMTYSQWAKNVLERQSGGKIQVFAVASPGADIDVFKPLDDKKEARRNFGLKEDIFLIQSVMRNQPRKLYPDILKSFNGFLDICRKNNREDLGLKTFLHFHTTYPDVGWDLPVEIIKHGLSHKVLFTYICDITRKPFMSFWSGETSWSPYSGKKSGRLPGTAGGASREQLAFIMGLADLYIQYSVAAGWEMPINDAKACGVPTAAVEHSAMMEQNYNGGGFPLPVERMFQESINQTGQLRALPDNEYTANFFYEFFTKPQEERDADGRAARECVEKFYNWDRIARIWESAIDSLEVPDQADTWLSKPKIIEPNLQVPANLSNQDFIYWCYSDIMRQPEKIHSTFARKTIGVLNLGYEPSQDGEGKPTKIPVDRDRIANNFLGYVRHCNQMEEYRYAVVTGKINERPELDIGVI